MEVLKGLDSEMRVIVFCNKKRDVHDIEKDLWNADYRCVSLLPSLRRRHRPPGPPDCPKIPEDAGVAASFWNRRRAVA
eukprot:253779-Pyramimonas_sp.AAC.1